jgi:hypothetical protein
MYKQPAATDCWFSTLLDLSRNHLDQTSYFRCHQQFLPVTFWRSCKLFMGRTRQKWQHTFGVIWCQKVYIFSSFSMFIIWFIPFLNSLSLFYSFYSFTVWNVKGDKHCDCAILHTYTTKKTWWWEHDFPKHVEMNDIRSCVWISCIRMF